MFFRQIDNSVSTLFYNVNNVERILRPFYKVEQIKRAQYFSATSCLRKIGVDNFVHTFVQANSAFHPSGVGKWVPASAGKSKTGMVHSVSGWTRGVQVKLWDPLKTRTIPERLRGAFTTRRYTNPRLPLPLPLSKVADVERFVELAFLKRAFWYVMYGLTIARIRGNWQDSYDKSYGISRSLWSSEMR